MRQHSDFTGRRLAVALLLAAASAGAQAGEERPGDKAEFRVYRQWPFDAEEARRRQRETARALGVAVERKLELAPGAEMTLVLIPPGQFMMGSAQSAADVARLAGLDADTAKYFEDEHPQHRVTIRAPFWMGKYEVTQEQWEAVMGTNPSGFKGAKNPVERVEWNHVQDFLRKANARVRDGTLGLPTEAQWEYACRAGTATPFHFGETVSTDQANYDGDYTYADGPKGVYREETTPVGSFPPNAWGLHDMHGNVWEWCADWYDEDYYARSPTADPTGPADGRLRVLRGGSWYGGPWYCRSAPRVRGTPALTFSRYGFRVVVSLSAARTSP